MSEIPDDVLQALCTIVGKAELGDLYDETDCDWQYFTPEVETLLNALRADPELAAKALGGEVELRFGERKDDTGRVWDAPQWVAEKITSEDIGWSIVQRDALVVLYPWREVTK